MAAFRWIQALAAVLLIASWAPAPLIAEDPWQTLEAARKGLVEEGATAADFVHTYKAPDFETADQETGRLALLLPRCLRWDYLDPDPKSVLICEDQVYAWSPEDGAGRHYEVDPEGEAGLDLLLLPTDELKLRYRADAKDTDDGLTVITLEPVTEAQIKLGRLVIQRANSRLVALEYEDLGGGSSRFEISGYQSLTDRSLFDPPEGVEWSSP
ncbi:MAG: outer membrane lipoprotein carrier protein LolA [Acidobacteria bacterium]|nr:outer membrane lipoprotein carrier protein LolA [Acidobacteriota bacterium]